MENRLRLLGIAILMIGILLAGCAQAPPAQAAPNATAPTPSPSATAPPSAPAPAQPSAPAPPAPAANQSAFNPTIAASNLSWSGKKALFISQMQVGDELNFSTGTLRLTDFSRAGLNATLQLTDAQGNPQGTIYLSNAQAVQFHETDGLDYLVVAVFDLSQGVQNSLQVQLYRVKDLSAPSSPIRVGEPQNAYTIIGEFPTPLLAANQSLAVGGSVNGSAFNTVLAGLDLGASPAKASYQLQDGSGQILAQFNLNVGQMMSFVAPDGHHYAVIFRRVDGSAAITEVFQLQAFSS